MVNVEVLPSVNSDHSLIYLKLVENTTMSRGRSYWKFNNSFLKEPDYISAMRTEIEKIKNTELTLIADPRMKWEVLKYRIRQFSRSYSINAAGKRNRKRQELERKVIEMESKICSSSSDYVLKEYHEAKAELEQIYDYITEGIILCSRSTWYEKRRKVYQILFNIGKAPKVKNICEKINFQGN